MRLPWRLFAGILFLWLLIGFIPLLIWGHLSEAAEFANTFGFVNALFAALAFGGVIWAIRLQTKELELQRQEIEETRDELRRSADAQHKSQQMHFLSALLNARNNVAQGYATAAQLDTGPLQSNRTAHRQHLAELEWLLHMIERQDSNPFPLPMASQLVAHQAGLLLTCAYPLLQAALSNGAQNYARELLLDLNQALRELRRCLADDTPSNQQLRAVLDRATTRGETVNQACSFDEVVEICEQTFNALSSELSRLLETTLPKVTCGPEGDHRSVLRQADVP